MSLFKPPAYSHGDRLEAAGHVLRLSVNARARRISLRVDRTRREVIATAPTARRLGEAVAFARERVGWIEAQLADLPEARVIAPGMTVELFGAINNVFDRVGPVMYSRPQSSFSYYGGFDIGRFTYLKYTQRF